mmetsp:Transcript_24838/g.63009  ORF Transcript_24838/g.63009 Transcript_24838/m.63009 type:complete len:369 (-) Transcript_24838:144-1250(-)
MEDLHVLVEPAAAHPDKRDAVPVLWVHVCLELEHKAGELLVVGGDRELAVGAGRGGQGEVDEAVQERLNPEIVVPAAKPHRGLLLRPHQLHVEGVNDLVENLELLLEVVQQVFGHQLGKLGVLEPVDLNLGCLLGTSALLAKNLNGAGGPIIDSHEAIPGANRPRDRRGLDLEHVLDGVQQLEGLEGRAVHLVDEGEEGQLPLLDDIEELERLRLKALGPVEKHHGIVGCGDGPVRVLAEVLVPWGVKEVELHSTVLKLKGGGGDGDTPVLLNLHPVARRSPSFPFGLDGPRLLHRASVEEQLLRHRSLTCVRMGDDGKRPPALDFPGQLLCGGRIGLLARRGGCLRVLHAYRTDIPAPADRPSPARA